MWISDIHPHPEMRKGSTIGSWMMFLILIVSLSGYGYSLGLLLTALFILLVVSVGVSVFIESRIPTLSWLS